MQDPYCYPDSRVLKNKFNIRDFDKLSLEERKFAKYRARELFEDPIQGRFDFDHLRAIHRHLFQDVYDWAGEVRTVDIAKGNMFCRCFAIEPEAERIFGELKAEKYLRGMMVGEVAGRLAYYLSEINALHPFREGNGRAQREFVRQLALLNGYFLSFRGIRQDEMIEASKASFRLDYEPMERIILGHLRGI
ncbi:Fic family protein [Candidatus Saccharibacteria bacterium]|nr:Fic family protein [Candidatus Saccharibacteria bacterium]MBR0424001.1 Fic family protein [Candidatus Saccharibacteria bacterium]